eukprot:scaffold3088_cov107-Isochrysis_galbana.AAC.3
MMCFVAGPCPPQPPPPASRSVDATEHTPVEHWSRVAAPTPHAAVVAVCCAGTRTLLSRAPAPA